MADFASSGGNWDNSQDDDGGGGAVVNDSIEKLSNAWRTEVNAPEILPFKHELVDEMQQLLKNQVVRAISTDHSTVRHYERADSSMPSYHHHASKFSHASPFLLVGLH